VSKEATSAQLYPADSAAVAIVKGVETILSSAYLVSAPEDIQQKKPAAVKILWS
jgi:hypothetical protein